MRLLSQQDVASGHATKRHGKTDLIGRSKGQTGYLSWCLTLPLISASFSDN